MSLKTIILATTDNNNPQFPELVGITEFSVLAILAIYLIKNIWKEHEENERHERELTIRLMDRLLGDKPHRERKD